MRKPSAFHKWELVISNNSNKLSGSPGKKAVWLYTQMDYFYFIQFSSVAQLCLTLCYPMNCSMPGLPVHHQLLEFTQTHVHRVSDAIQPSHPLSSPSPPAPIPPSIKVFSNESTLAWGGQSIRVAPPKHLFCLWSWTLPLSSSYLASQFFKSHL